MIFGNYIRNQEKKLNQMRTESQFQKIFLGKVYTLTLLLAARSSIPQEYFWREIFERKFLRQALNFVPQIKVRKALKIIMFA